MSKTFRPLVVSKNVIKYLDDTFIQSQTQQEMFKVLNKYLQILLKEYMKAAPVKLLLFLHRVKIFGHFIVGTKVTPLKSQIDPTLKLQLTSNKKNLKNFWNAKLFI